MTRDYRRFEEYLGRFRELALELLGEIVSDPIVRRFFSEKYSEKVEQYWSIKKLYSLAMFLPVFLQIGLSYLDKGLFTDLVYVDTHAGPGLAKVGPEEDDVVPGSPVIALRWPEVVADVAKKFRKIRRGFTKYFFIEKNPEIYGVLKRVVDRARGEREAIPVHVDSNVKLPTLARELCENRNPLVLIFIDPFGELDSQLTFRALSSFLRCCKVDVVLNVMSGMLARGLATLATTNHERYKFWLERLFDRYRHPRLDIWRYYVEKTFSQVHISRESIVKAYAYMLRRLGYGTIYSIPVEFRGENVLYHLLFASRSPGAESWLGSYYNYIKEQLPKSHEEIKGVWFKVSGKGLFRFM